MFSFFSARTFPAGILRDQPHRFFQGAPQNIDADLFVSVTLDIFVEIESLYHAGGSNISHAPASIRSVLVAK